MTAFFGLESVDCGYLICVLLGSVGLSVGSVFTRFLEGDSFAGVIVRLDDDLLELPPVATADAQLFLLDAEAMMTVC